MQKIDSHVKSQWTHSLNFNLLCLGAFMFTVVALLMLKGSHFAELFIALAMAFGFVMTAIFFTARRNLKFIYSDQHLELQRFPYVAAKKWSWDEVRGIHGDDTVDPGLARSLDEAFDDEYRGPAGGAERAPDERRT